MSEDELRAMIEEFDTDNDGESEGWRDGERRDGGRERGCEVREGRGEVRRERGEVRGESGEVRA